MEVGGEPNKDDISKSLVDTMTDEIQRLREEVKTLRNSSSTLSPNDILLGRIPRNAKEEWKVVKGRWAKNDYVDIRLYENNRPTRKGARLNLEELMVLKQILRKVNLGDEENDMDIQ